MVDSFAVRYFCDRILYRKVVAWMIGEARGLLSLRFVTLRGVCCQTRCGLEICRERCSKV